MTDLSPQAQAVLDAMYEVNMDFDGENATLAAAALEAAADQVVPEETWLGTDETCYAYYRQRCNTRHRLLAIAAELLGQEALAQPQTSKKELTDEQLLKCFKIATPCYNMEGWRRELDGMRAAIAADRALCAELQGLTDEEILRIAAKIIEPYETCGIALGEYEAETECAVEVYGSELIAFAHAIAAELRGQDQQHTKEN